MAAEIGNKYALGNNGGRPPIFETPEEFNQKVIEYFEWVKGESHTEKIIKLQKDPDTGEKEPVEVEVTVWDREPERITITGLALFLGFASRQSLFDYGKKDEFSYHVKRAAAVVENAYEQMLGSQTPTGAIFALKNMGWRDSVAVEQSGNISVTWHEEKTYEAES